MRCYTDECASGILSLEHADHCIGYKVNLGDDRGAVSRCRLLYNTLQRQAEAERNVISSLQSSAMRDRRGTYERTFLSNEEIWNRWNRHHLRGKSMHQ